MNKEHDEQVALMNLCRMYEGQHPELALVYAIPNAARRSPRQGKWMKDEGLRAGVPDLCLPVARQGYHGLYIEMKAGKNKPTNSQAWWLEKLREQEYRVAVCYDHHDAWDRIIDYFKGSK